MRGVSEALAALASADVDSLSSAANGIECPQLVYSLLKSGCVLSEEPTREWTHANHDGLFRLQHASVLYRVGSKGILVDPHFHSAYDTAPGEGIDYPDLRLCADTVLITHCHEDHFYLSGLMMLPKSTTIVVPKVRRPTVICPNMAELLKECGFENVIEAEWYKECISTDRVRVTALPFYGEQPTETDGNRDPDLRNWGNTYLVEADGIASWLLVDSGQDAIGSMTAVAQSLADAEIHVDIVLSNLRMFGLCNPLYINLGLNWLTLRLDQLESFHDRTDRLTLGALNVARICKTVGARYYLPYAHWWGGVGKCGDAAIDTPGQDELSLLDELRRCLRKINCRTQILDWTIGDRFRLGPWH